MDRRGWLLIAVGVLTLARLGARACAQPKPVDDPTSLNGWTAVTSDGVELALSRDVNHPGSLRMDFDFKRGSGYAVARLRAALPFAENFRFDFKVRGEGLPAGGAPSNTLEFKLIDRAADGEHAGDNVWWVNRPRFEFGRDWKPVTLRRRHFSIAWGPDSGKPLKEIGYIEVAITAGAAGGGKGSVWIENLTFQELPPDRPYSGTPMLSASSGAGNGANAPVGAAWPLGPDGRANWVSDSGKDAEPWLMIDFGVEREFGGLVVEWSGDALLPIGYSVLSSQDNSTWTTIAEVESPEGTTNILQSPEASARFVKFQLHPVRGRAVGVRGVRVLPVEFGESPNEVWKLAAKERPAGHFPAYFLGQAAYWTVVGVDGDQRESLVGEFGAVETDKGGFSLEPFVFMNGRLFSWADARESTSHELAKGYLPIPSVMWNLPAFSLEITAFGTRHLESEHTGTPAPPERAADNQGSTVTLVRYVVANNTDAPLEARLFVAIRPFQVNPVYQFLNTAGGFAPIHLIEDRGDGISVDNRLVVPLTRPAGFGATSLNSGDASVYMARGDNPPFALARDENGLASGVIAFDLALDKGAKRTVWIALPTDNAEGAVVGGPPRYDGGTRARRALRATEDAWAEALNRSSMTPPRGAEHLWDVVRSQLAYVLINRDGPAIQPGSRSYERTWIRDGSLTCNALLDFGHYAEVRDFLDWFAPMQYDSGKVPCCADSRGPDPVPENDSHGELLYALATYYRHTGDRSLLERHWDRVVKAVSYMQWLRSQRMTSEYADAPEASIKRAMTGLMPESISHEGYSAKPMHSLWDSLFAMRGYKDAQFIASSLGKEREAAQYGEFAASMRAALVESYRRTMAHHGIDYLPGCVELGDFDATSTTIALFPVDEAGHLPEPGLRNTFEKYWKYFTDRRDGRLTSPWESYTPYEVRTIGAFVRLGWRDRAQKLIGYFVNDQIPREWNAFSEVVWRDRRKPAFIGDIPHTWCGSDFVNSFRSMFVYEREHDESLVLLHGVSRDWLLSPSGFSLTNWSTGFGGISVRVEPDAGAPDRTERAVVLRINSGDGSVEGMRALSVPRGGLVVMPPEPERIRAVTVDGHAATVHPDGSVRVNVVPAEVRLTYRE